MVNQPNYLIICGRCKHKIAMTGVKRVLPYKLTCPKCGFTAKIKRLFRSVDVPRRSNRMLAVSMSSFAYAEHIGRWNGEEEKQP